MTEFQYKNWEVDKGLEDLQAEVFNEANQYKFAPASGDQIRQEYEQEKIDPNTIRYAFKGEKMIAYVKGRVREKAQEVHLSFPWAIEGTPVEVQDKLFGGLLEFLKEKYPSYTLRVNVMANPKENLEFLDKYGFVEKNVWKMLYISQKSLAESPYEGTYTTRVGREMDIDDLIKLIHEDGRYSAQFPKDEDIMSYFKEKVLETGHLILISEGDELIAASAPLVFAPTPEDEERIIQRFSAYKYVKEQKGSIPLLIEMAKECITTGYGRDKPFLVYTDNMDSPSDQREFLNQLTPEKSEILMYYYYLD